MSQTSDKVPQPPQPPKFDRRLQFYPLQLIGVPLLLVLPVLALLGVFGAGSRTVSASSESLELQVRYPSRLRYGLIREMQVAVRNSSDQALSAVTVALDRGYVDAFSQVSFTPSADTVTDETYQVDLGDLQPGESRLVDVELQADAYGTHRGAVTASSGSAPPAQVELSTLTFP